MEIQNQLILVFSFRPASVTVRETGSGCVTVRVDADAHKLMNGIYIEYTIPMSMCYLDDANGFPWEVEAGVEQEGEDERESSVPAERKHKRAALSAEGPQNTSFE